MRGCIRVWFIPPAPPIRALAVARNIYEFDLGFMDIMISDRGMIFCHVDRRIQINQLESVITDGNQKWAGAMPSLIISPRVMISSGAGFGRINSGLWDIVVAEMMISPEPRACAIKYFTALSVSCLCFLEVMRGINDRAFSSNIDHRMIRFLAEMAVRVLMNREEENSVR